MGPSSNRGGCVIAASFGHLVTAREQGRRQVEAKPRPLNAYAYGIETLAASPTCWAHIFNVGRSLRLAYPEAEAAGGARSAPSGGGPNQRLAVFYSGDRFATGMLPWEHVSPADCTTAGSKASRNGIPAARVFLIVAG